MLSDNDLQLASAVLAKCAAYDPWFPRPDGEQAHATVQAWATTFADSSIESEFILRGVDRFYAENGGEVRVLPATILDIAHRVRNEAVSKLSNDQRRVYDEAIYESIVQAREKGWNTGMVRVQLPRGDESVADLVTRTLGITQRSIEEHQENNNA